MIDGIEYYLARLTGLIFQILPRSGALWLGEKLGLAVNIFWKSRRLVVLRNLEIAFGDEMSSDQRAELSRRVFANIGRTLAETCRAPVTSREELLEIIDCEGTENYLEAVAYGKGTVIVSSHFGNWEYFGANLVARGYDADVVARGQHNRLIDKYLTNLRNSFGMNVLHSERGGMKEAIRALRQNRQVAILSDQHEGSQGVIVDFFGQKVSAPRAPAALSQKTGAPIITSHLFRMPDNRHLCRFDKLIYPDMEADREEEIKRLAQEYTYRIETAIRRRPDLWLWTHRRFKPVDGAEQSTNLYVK